MLDLFDRYYSKTLFVGLVAGVWFAAFFEAAHNVWSASVVFAGITLLSVIFCIGRSRDRKSIRLPLLLPSILLLIALRLSFRQAYDLETAWLEFWGWTFTLLIFYLFFNTVETDEQADRFFTIAGLIVVPLACHCLWQRLSPPPVINGVVPTVGLFGYGFFEIPLTWLNPGRSWTLRYGHWEIHATLVNSIVMAGFFLYWTLFYWKKTSENRRYAILFMMCVVGLIFARSWWAFAVLFMGFLFYYRFKFKEWFRRYRLAVLGMLGCFLLFLAIAYYAKTYNRTERPIDTTHYRASSRMYYWLAALRMWRRSPWTGVGLGGYATAYPHYKTDAAGENTRFAHGIIPQLLSETGFIGGLALCSLLFSYLKLRFRKIDQPDGLTNVFDATLLMALGFAFISIFLDFLLNRFTFFLVLAASLRSVPMQKFRIRPLYLTSAGLCLILLIPFWLNLFTASRLFAEGLNGERKEEFTKAITFYKNAVQVEPYHADSYWRLSNLYARAYKAEKKPEDLAASQHYQQQALRYKKDIRFRDTP